jgi:hypothetical protein
VANQEVDMAGQQRGSGLLPILARVDRTKVFLGALAIAVLGLFLPKVLGGLLLYALVAALGAVLSVTWAVTPPAMRIFRVVTLAALAAIATTKLLS